MRPIGRTVVGLESEFGCRVDVTAPSGAVVWSVRSCSPSRGAFFDTLELPEDGIYTIGIDPSDAEIGSLTATVYLVPDDVSMVVHADGDPVTLDITVPGQGAQVAFTGLAGDRVSLEVPPDSLCVGVTLQQPSGATMPWPRSCRVSDSVSLPEDGTYTILVDPGGADVGAVTMTLHVVPNDAAALVIVDGDPVTIEITVMGQKGVITFVGNAGDQVALDVSYLFQPCGVKAVLVAPSGTTLRSTWCPATIGPIVLAETGTYVVRFDPYAVPDDVGDGEVPEDPDDYPQTGTITASLRAVPD